MTHLLISSTGTHHIPAVIEHGSDGPTEAVCGRYEGETIELESSVVDPARICTTCREQHPRAYAPIENDDTE
jgi:hypothetical protein